MSKQILEHALGKPMLTRLWTSACPLALPIIPQGFALPATLAPVLYMLRWNKRRGKGNFIAEFGNPSARLAKDKAATAQTVAEKLLEPREGSYAFSSNPDYTIVLADLLLAYCFENKGRSQERTDPIQRVYPTHYFASWIDLPETIANLRGIPEFIVGTLRASTSKRRGSIDGMDEFFRNPLVLAMGDGLSVERDPADRQSDSFKESQPVGIDQLLTIRVAQRLAVAPIPQAGSPIPPVTIPAERAHAEYYEDLNIFLRAYGHSIPRLTLIPMLEAGLATGLTSVLMSTIELFRNWEHTGKVPGRKEQTHWPLFVDCSGGADRDLRSIAEESMAGATNQLQRLSIQLMLTKTLLYQAESLRVPGFTRNDNPLQKPIASLNTLGELLDGSHEMSQRLRDSLEEKCVQLVELLEADQGASQVRLLEDSSRHPAWRLSEFTVSAMGNKLQFENLRKFLDSCLMANAPNGLATRRTARRQQKAVDQRSLSLSNTALDFLVHRHLRQGKRGVPIRNLSVANFIVILRERYGFYVCDPPRGVDVPAELLRRNRVYLERRLRDLGLLSGVNDAESMKRLRPRYGDVAANEEPDAATQDEVEDSLLAANPH